MPVVHASEAVDLVRLNALDGLQGLCEVMRSCYAFSLAGDASSNIQSKAYFSLRIRCPP